MYMNYALLGLGGILVGIGASFTGLGGGFLIVPLLLALGYSAQKAVGTSFLAILVIAVSALVAHNKLANVDYRVGVLLGVGGDHHVPEDAAPERRRNRVRHHGVPRQGQDVLVPHALGARTGGDEGDRVHGVRSPRGRRRRTRP